MLYHFLPRAWRPGYQRAGQFGLLILMGLVFLYPPFFLTILRPVNILMGLADSFVELWI